MSEGGEARFCAKDRPHDKSCQYFSDGGAVLPSFDDMPDEKSPDALPSFDDMPDEKTAPLPSFDDMPDENAGKDANADLDPAALQEKIFNKYHPNGLSDYEAPGQQAATVAEGLAQGVAGPVATLAETKLLGIDPKDIAGRQKANPWEHGLAETAGVAGSLATGVGEAGLIAKGVEGATEYARLGKIGSAVVNGMITNGMVQAGDEASKAILGQGNPEDAVNPVLAIGAAAFLGALGGFGGAATSRALTSEATQTAGTKLAIAAKQKLAGIAHAASGAELPTTANEAFKSGFASYKDIPNRIAKLAAGAIGSQHSPEAGNIGYIWGDKLLGPLISKVTARPGKYAVPATMRWLSKGAQGSLFKVIDYANKVEKGTSIINNSIDALFKSGSQQSVNSYKPGDVDRLKNWIDGGGMVDSIKKDLNGTDETPEGYAGGGEVNKPVKAASLHVDDHLAANFPEQNILIQAAKGRISNYLSSMRPQKNAAKLAFDDSHDDREEKRNYDKALQIALSPTSVLDHIKAGTIVPEHITHLNSMYPELTGHLQQKMTKRIVQAQLDGEKPSYKVRQGMSLFLGAPLNSEMLPQNIQAAQAVFANAAKPPASSNGQATPTKNSKASLSKSEQAYLTSDQAREQRRQKM